MLHTPPVNDPLFVQQWSLSNTGQPVDGQAGVPGGPSSAPTWPAGNPSNTARAGNRDRCFTNVPARTRLSSPTTLKSQTIAAGSTTVSRSLALWAYAGLVSMLDDPKKRMGSGIDGMMAGYVLLQPKVAWAYMTKLVKDDTEEFYVRYAVLRTLRFFWDYRTDVLGKQQILEGMEMVTKLPDLSDFAIDDLRTWKQWQMTDKVLDLYKLESHNLPVVKRADASTLDVVNAVKANMGRFQAALPDDVKISYEFDESPIVYRAIDSVGMEGALGAGLTGLMVLLFLRDIRSVVVVVLNIPLALLGSVVVR